MALRKVYLRPRTSLNNFELNVSAAKYAIIDAALPVARLLHNNATLNGQCLLYLSFSLSLSLSLIHLLNAVVVAALMRLFVSVSIVLHCLCEPLKPRVARRAWRFYNSLKPRRIIYHCGRRLSSFGQHGQQHKLGQQNLIWSAGMSGERQVEYNACLIAALGDCGLRLDRCVELIL